MGELKGRREKAREEEKWVEVQTDPFLNTNGNEAEMTIGPKNEVRNEREIKFGEVKGLN